MIQKSTSYPQIRAWNCDRRQAVVGDQPVHRRLEDAVGRLAVEHPLVEGIAERRHAVTSAPGVHVDRRPQGRRRRQPVRDDMADGGRHRRRVDSPEVAEQAEDVGRADVVAQHRREVLAVARPVHDHAVERRLAATLGEHHVDRVARPVGVCPTGGRPSGARRSRPARPPSRRRRSAARACRHCRRAGRPRDAAPRAHRTSARYHPARDRPRRSAACLVTNPWCSAAYWASAGRSTPALGVAAAGKGKADELGGFCPGFRDRSRPDTDPAQMGDGCQLRAL